MARNDSSHFSILPSANIQRSIFKRSSRHTTSFNVGDVVPLFIDEILPGDSVEITMSKLVRLQTLHSPIFDDLFFDTYWFFVPNRLTWEHWQEFQGENTQSAWAPKTSYSVPKLFPPEGGWQTGTIADFLGIPVGVSVTDPKKAPSALPFRGYSLICNSFFRDENLTDPLNVYVGDSSLTGSNGDNFLVDVPLGGKPFKAAKLHDYFTSSLPSPQKGHAVNIPIPTYSGGTFPVKTGADQSFEENSIPLRFFSKYFNQDGSWSSFGSLKQPGFSTLTGSSGSYPMGYNDGSGELTVDRPYVFPANLEVTVPGSTATNFTVNDLRYAFAAQEFLERNARGGSRYAEILRNHFGVISPDARLQTPEYLGGNRIRLNVSAVANTAQTDKDFLGDLGANSVTADVHFDVRKSFTEHGFLFCLGLVRYRHTYAQGLERFWLRDSVFDFYLPVFSSIGEQPVYRDEIFYSDDNPVGDVFAYQEAWSDYRYKPSRVSGELRPNINNSLFTWTLADNYSSPPVLSDSWIREDASNVDRVLTVSSSVSNQVFGDFAFDVRHTRPMPMFSVPAHLGRM